LIEDGSPEAMAWQVKPFSKDRATGLTIETFAEHFNCGYANQGTACVYKFIVPAGSLGLSVITFSSCALCALGLLYFNRITSGGELGGPPGKKMALSIVLVTLWLVYIGVSSAIILTK